MRRIALIRLLSGSVFLAAALLTAGDAGAYPNAGPAETAAVIRDSTWDPGRRDSWSAFTVSVSSEHGFSGEVRLVPTPLRQADGAQMPEPDRPAPTLRAPLVLEAGVERSMAVMAPVGETAYRGELWDVSGARVSVGQARRAEMRASINLGVLTDLPNGGALLQAASQQQPNVRRRFWSTGDFPASVLSLTGLDGLIVGNLDSNALSVEQRQALQDFVGLGGSLLLTGGVEGQRTAAALPDVLVPLRPDGTAVASLGPLAELDKQTTNRVTIIITGALDSGRVAVGAVGGPPLVVEARYGWGHIIQLTYDPFAVAAEPQAAAAPQSTGVIFRPVAWSVGLLQNGRATALSAAAAPPLPGRHPASPPAPAWSVLEGEAGPGGARGGPVGLLLVAYPFVAGGLLLVLGRSRSRGALRWVAVPALAALVTVAVLPVGWGLRGALNVDELSIERLGPPGGAGELESFHRMVASGRADLVLRLANPSLASITADPRPSRALPAVLAERNPQRGPGDDQIEVGDAPSVSLRQLAGWDARRLHTLTPTRAAGGIEAHLRLQAGHLVGTVTNRGERPVRRLRAQRGDAGQAQLASELGPGATARVDVPFAPVAPAVHQEPESAILDTAAATVSGDLPPGALVLVGLVAAPPALPAQRDLRMHTVHRAVVAPAQLEGADDFALDFGTTRALCCGTSAAGVYELQVPTGMAGPFAINHLGVVGAAVYDWTTGGWRPLPSGRENQQTAILPAEIRDGVVRVRAESDEQAGRIRAVAPSTAGP